MRFSRQPREFYHGEFLDLYSEGATDAAAGLVSISPRGRPIRELMRDGLGVASVRTTHKAVKRELDSGMLRFLVAMRKTAVEEGPEPQLS
jgi:hypothetical protein